jgi:16S rRNA (guanine527-N7)-methyltransferase
MSTSAATQPSEKTIRRALSEFGLTANELQVSQIQKYIEMLLRWNEKLNLTAIRDPLEMLYRHFCESMFATVAVPVEKGRLADIGAGAGFPGLALKIIRPELQIFLIECDVKKATFLAEVTRHLELSDVRVMVTKYEELSEEITPLDFVCSRALGDFDAFLRWSGSARIAATSVILWVGTRDLEQIQKVEGWKWREPIPVPQSLRRVLLVGSRETEVGAPTN